MPEPGYPTSAQLLPTARSSTSTPKAYETAACVQRPLPIRLQCNTLERKYWNISGEFTVSTIADGYPNSAERL